MYCTPVVMIVCTRVHYALWDIQHAWYFGGVRYRRDIADMNPHYHCFFPYSQY